jgi:hypothetical protein
MPFDNAEAPLSAAPAAGRRRGLRLWRLLARGVREPAPFRHDVRSHAIMTQRLLEEARQVIAARERWTQGVYESAERAYCAIGALRAAGRRFGDEAAAAQGTAHELLRSVAQQRGFLSVERMNDRSAHGEILAAFDEAIAAARRRERNFSGIGAGL